jgi:hypothetical protein
VAIIARQRLHVEHVLYAVNLLFQRCGDSLGHHLGRGAGILRMDNNRRRHHRRIFGDRQLQKADNAGEQEQGREDARKDRAIDEEAGDVHLTAASDEMTLT